ncbi:MAG: acyl carrier protein [Kiritimatiellae bacterium]|nr:acyl carrier protein [Kiritimatiellia bacterium]
MNDTLRTLFADILQHPMPVFTASTAFADLPGWDSVAHLALLLAVERHFKIAFTSAQMVQMKTIGEMTAILEAHHG